jgi:hypothetical protein
MKTNSLHPALFAGIVALAACSGAAALAASDASPQVSMTRPMMVFAGLERQLADAVSARDKAATDSMLSQDFEFRPGAHPGEPTPRADWLADAAARGTGSDQLSVRDLGDATVVSFVMAMADHTSSYVIDVWKKQGANWQLISRYQSALPAANPPTEDTAPTGKG